MFILTIFLSCCFPAVLHAQNQLIDSFYRELKNAKSDSVKLNIRARIALENSKKDFIAAEKELDEVKRICLEKNLPFNYVYAERLLGAIYYERGDYVKAIITYNELETAIQRLPEGKRKAKELGMLYNDLGASYSLINDLENAQKFYSQSIQLYEISKDSSGLILTYFNLAFVFIDMQEWAKAIDYLKKSIDNGGKTVDRQLLAFDSYARAAAISFKLNRMQEGRKLLADCERLFPQVPLDLDRIYFHNAYGEFYYAQNNMKAALASHVSSYQYSLLWRDPYYISDEALHIGKIYMQLGKADSAEHYFRIALDTAKAYNYMPKIRFILNEWSDYYASAGNYREAYLLRTELLHFTDSLVALQNHNRLLLFDARFQSIQKENKIKQLETDKQLQAFAIRQKNILNYILIGGAFIILIISLLTYRNYRQKQKLQQQRITELETEKKLAATEAVLKGEEQERTRLAKDLHDGLGGMLSGIKHSFTTMKGNIVLTPDVALAFERSMDMLDSSIKELRMVAHNLMPESLVKFGLDTALKDFCNSITGSGVLQVDYHSFGMEQLKTDQNLEITLYRIIQELVNNSIKHAAAKEAIVQLQHEYGLLSVTVEDNGKGFDTACLDMSRGIGWSNIQNRVDYLKGTLSLISEKGKGTSVTIEIKV